MKKIEVGDYITFKAATREGCRKARRKVIGVSQLYVIVRYIGWGSFWVRPDEIIKVEKKGK